MFEDTLVELVRHWPVYLIERLCFWLKATVRSLPQIARMPLSVEALSAPPYSQA